MNKKLKLGILTLILLVFIILGTKPVWVKMITPGQEVESSSKQEAQEISNETEAPGLENYLSQFFNQDKPVAVVYTYEADCCPSTEKYFKKHREAVKQLKNKYGDKINFAWIDIAHYQTTEPEKLAQKASEMNINTIPALVLLDEESNVIQSWVGELNTDKVEASFEQVVK